MTFHVESDTMPNVNVWLDDVRDAPAGWVHCRTIEDVQRLLQTGEVVKLSLDHDLGYALELNQDWFSDDEEGKIVAAVPLVYDKTGYDLVKWMAENNCWPKEKPTIHSMNPVGRRNMAATIDRYFGGV